MASSGLQTNPLSWRNVRGRNGFDPPSVLEDDIAAEAVNVRLGRKTLPQKRFGSVAQTFTGDSFSGYNSLHRFVPGQNDAAAELIFTDRSGTPKFIRVAGGSAADELTLVDNISTRAQDVRSAVLNGKIYFAYDSAVNRLHVFDPGLSTTQIRRAGIPAPAAPSVANTGSGSYPSQTRYYRIAWREYRSGTLRRQGPLGSATSFTPSGSGTAVRVTKPTAASEGETHWVIYGSKDGLLYYELDEVVVGTTTYDDSDDPDDYSLNDAAPSEGAYTPPPSAKYLISTGERLVMFGAYETTAGDGAAPKNGRVWWTPVLDSSALEADDDERISMTTEIQGFMDVGRDSGAEDRALVGPMDNQIFAIQSRGFVMLVPTEDAFRPYKRVVLNPNLGAVSHESSFVGEDEVGRPCVYFLDPEKGPMRYGWGGFQWLGYEIQDLWDTFNPAAANRTAHGVFDKSQKVVKWWIATGSADDPDKLLVFDVRRGRMAESVEEVRGGWSQDTGAVASARCSCMLPASFGATMSRKLKPYAGFSSSLLRTDDSAATDDNGTTFQAYVTSRAFEIRPLNVNKSVGLCYLQAKAANGVTIRQSLINGYGEDTANDSDVLLTADGSETRVLRKFEDAELTNWFAMQVTLGDAAAVANAWSLDEWTATIEVTDEER